MKQFGSVRHLVPTSKCLLIIDGKMKRMAETDNTEHPVSMERLAKITVVVPTFNRHQHLSRLLRHYASRELPVSLLVLDSSHQDTAELNRQLIGTLGDRFQYVSFESSLSVAQKLSQGLALVRTPYCSLCADDDLVFRRGLVQALEFLEEHPDYVCADGIYLNFFPKGKDIQLIVEYASTGIEARNAGARVFRLFQKYESMFYGVFRTPDLAAIFSTVARIPSLHFQELFQATAALLIGKSHRCPEFYGARQHCDPAEPNREKWQTYYWFADNRDEFLDHYRSYREELWGFYERRGAEPRQSKDSFFRAMDLAHSVFFGTGCPPDYFYSVLQSEWPGDPYKKPSQAIDDICNRLKGPWRRAWEKYIKQFSNMLLDKASVYSLPLAVNNLNRTVRRICNTPWNCLLRRELRWIASKKQFRDAYLELCSYLDHG